MPNYGEPGRGPRLAEGMVLAIEPMVNVGKPAVKVLADGWTAVTRDGSLSAHFEHTVAVTAGRAVDSDGAGSRRCSARRRQDPTEHRRRSSRDRRARRCRTRSIGWRSTDRGRLTAHIAERTGGNFIRVLVGDRVRLELSSDGT